ncbi:MAG: hypothetical protein LBV72_08305 [Tannerella sp.]|jgi:tRNA A-37 threonylcarbamoyl transferase component Bud32|nr:hypothetical protein [Tannerella sp.]
MISGQKTVIHPNFEVLREFIQSIPFRFDHEGTVIYKGRNELRHYSIQGYELIVKAYKRPVFINRIAYGFLRSSKAERAYRYALKLLKAGFKTPEPVGFITCRQRLLFDKSFSISLKSNCPYTYKDLSAEKFSRYDEIINAIVLFTARFHEAGFLHKDYSAGNILFDDTTKEIAIEIIDLNRITFTKVGLEKGCRNFERLPAKDDTLSLMGTTYAKARGFDPDTCIRIIKKYIQIELKKRLKQS